MRFDPREKEAVELPNSFGNVDFTDKLFKSNLGEPEQISERIEKLVVRLIPSLRNEELEVMAMLLLLQLVKVQ